MTLERLLNSFIPPKTLYPQNKFLATPLVMMRLTSPQLYLPELDAGQFFRPNPTRLYASMAVSNHRIFCYLEYLLLYFGLCAKAALFHYNFDQKHHKNCKIHTMHLRYLDPYLLKIQTRHDPRVDPTRIHP